MNKSYQKLCTEFYNLSKPEAEAKEVQFYEHFLKNANGPILEAMCGSGRLLIPLLEKEYTLDGVDTSPEMLASCLERCQSSNLKANLYNQPLQNMSLPNKYGLIFIAVGSFQLIENRSDAKLALKKLYEHLLLGGMLLLDTFIPWDGIRDCINGSILEGSFTQSFSKTVRSAAGFEITHKGKSIIYPHKQLEIYEGYYEKAVNSKIIAQEEERLAVRWYYHYEMELFLESCGFSDIHILSESFELNPQATIYQAIKS